jgi:hypothetical protein
MGLLNTLPKGQHQDDVESISKMTSASAANPEEPIELTPSVPVQHQKVRSTKSCSFIDKQRHEPSIIGCLSVLLVEPQHGLSFPG